jgi:hypothetical protein
MKPIDEQFIIRTDSDLIAKDVKLHARPFHVVNAWMRANQLGGDILDKRLWEPLMASIADSIRTAISPFRRSWSVVPPYEIKCIWCRSAYAARRGLPQVLWLTPLKKDLGVGSNPRTRHCRGEPSLPNRRDRSSDLDVGFLTGTQCPLLARS